MRSYKAIFIFALMLICCSELLYAQVEGYSFRRRGQINASQVTGTTDLSNFPVLMSLTFADFALTPTGNVQDPNGYDIIFTAADGVTQLAHQIESYNSSTGAIVFWVRFPTISTTTDTEFYIYYGNPDVSLDPSTTNVWDSNYKMVHHMDGNADDASGNGTDGVETGTTDAAGQIGRGRFFGFNQADIIQVLDTGTSPLDITGNITISFWMNITNLNEGPDLISKGVYTDGYAVWINGSGNLRFQINGNALNGSTLNPIAGNTWAYVTVTRSNSGRRIYVNGALDASDASTISFNTNNNPLNISTFDFDFEGTMDEVRISNIERDADWIQTEYNNQLLPGTFVTQINAEPLLVEIESTDTTYTSGDSPLAITQSINIVDEDTDMTGATISITGNFNNTEDLLGFTDQNGITGSYNSTSGILTLSGTATVAEYVTALRSVTYSNTNSLPAEITRTVSYQIDDGTDVSNLTTRDIDIIQVNNSPTLTNVEANPLVVFPGDSPKIVSSTVVVDDFDDANLVSAQIAITSNLVVTEDLLGFTNQNGITGIYTPGSGELNLTGSATLAEYQAAIRSITYENSSGTPTQLTRTISITVNDGNTNSIAATRNVEIATALTDPSTDFSNTVFHYDAQDVDGDLDLGDQPVDNSAVATWGDRSQNAGGSTATLNANQVLGSPLFQADGFGDRGGIDFSGTASLEPGNNGILNTSTYDQKSFAAVFRTGSSTAGLQIVFEQGAQVRGYQISVKDGRAYAFVWNIQEWVVADRYKSIDLGPVQPNTSYIIIMSHDATSGVVATSTWSASINGGPIIVLNNVDFQRAHSGNAVIGAEDGTVDPTTLSGNPATNNEFSGFIAELISWNTVLSSTDFANIFAYLSDKWFNDPPVLNNIETSDISFSEGDPATQITATLNVSDSDNTNLDGALVRISSGLNSSEDVLNYPAVIGSIIGSYNSGDGTLTLSGSDTPANYQTALRSITYQNTDAVSPSTDTRIIEFFAFDWDDTSAVVSRNINIIEANEVPVLANIEVSTLPYVEGTGANQITSAITISDADDANMESATIQITGNYILGEDELSFTDANGITSSFDDMSGTLTLTGTATLANYQTALRNVNYNNLSFDPVTGLDRTVTFTVNDGSNSSNTQERDISITSTNTAPLLSSIESELLLYSVGESIEISETIIVNDFDNTDLASATVQISGNYDSAEDSLIFDDLFGVTDSWDIPSGTLTLTGTASLSEYQDVLRTVKYVNTSNDPSDAIRTISFTVNDGSADSNTETRNVSISAVTAIQNLGLWLRGDDGTFTTDVGSTEARNDGETVGRWEDQSGNNRDFITTGTTDPLLRTSVGQLNLQNAIEFPGSSVSRLEDADGENYLNNLTEFTIFFVIKSDVTGTDRGFWNTDLSSGNDQFFSIRYDAAGDIGLGSNVIKAALRENIQSFELESSADVQTTNGQILALQWDSEILFDLYVDGVLDNPTAQGVIPSGLLTNLTTAVIGQGPLDATQSWDGLVAEVILYERSLNSTERESVEDYLSEKYGIPIRLLTKATGGDAISADSSNVVGGNEGFVTLSGPRLQEGFVGELNVGGTIILEAPTGYEWATTGVNPSLSIAAAFGGSTELLASFTSRTSSQLTFTIDAASTTTQGEITFSDLRVRPTVGVLPNTGEIVNVGTTGPGGTTSYGTLTMVPGTRIAMEFDVQPATSNVSSNISPSPRVQFIDQFGNDVEDPGETVTMSLVQVSGTGSLTGTINENTNTFGTAVFDDIQVDDTGTYALVASSTGLSNIQSDNFDVVVLGQLTQFLVERVPSGNISAKTAGTNFNIIVTAVDGIGATVTGFTGTAVISSNCTLGNGQGTTPSFINGVLSSLTVNITSVGNCSITATNSSGSETGTSNSFTVTAGAASEVGSVLSASPTVILNDGFSTSTITVDVKDAFGNDITVGGETVILNTNLGSISSVTDNSDGTYTATLTSSTVLGVATITGTLNGNGFTDNAQVEYAAFNTIWQSQIGAIPDARNWDDATNWSAGLVPSPGDIVLIPANPSVGNEFPVIDQNNTEVSQISVESSATVTVSGGINFVVSSDVSGGGSIQGSNTDTVQIGGDIDIDDITIGEVEFNGSTNQSLVNPHDYNDLEINNVAGVNASDDLTVSGNLNLTAGTLLIPSGKSLIANNKVIGSGNLRFQRTINGILGWRLISSPVSSTFGDLLDGTITQGYLGAFYSNDSSPGDTLQPNVLTYDETFPGTDNQRYRAPTSSAQALTAGQGMFVFFFGDIAADSRYNDPLPDTLDVTGQEFEGSGTEVDFGITYTADADTGFNLVGNPYGATINWDDPSWTKTNVDNTIYIWDPEANSGNGEYLTWNGVTGTLGSGLIPPFQGFWVKATSAAPSLIVNEDAKTNGGNFLRKASDQSISDGNTPRIVLELRQEELVKQTNIMFSGNARVGKDDLDAYELAPFSISRVELFSMFGDGTALAINNLPRNFTNRYLIPIEVNGFRDGAPVSGEFQLTLLGLRQAPDDWVVKLIDNQTGEEIDFKENPIYTFNHTTQERFKSYNPSRTKDLVQRKASSNTRFTLLVSTEDIEANIPREIFLDQNYPNPFNPSTVIPFGLNEDSDVKLEVFDILGRKIQTLVNDRRTAGNYNIRFNATGLASGVYIYRLQTDSKVITRKLLLIR